MNRPAALRIAFLVIVAVVAVLGLWLLPVRDWVAHLLVVVRDLGIWGLVVIAAVYTPASIFLIPGSLLTLGAGFIYPLGQAFLAVSLGSTMAAAVVFLLGRTLARSWVEGRLANMPRFRALDRAVGDRGFLIVFLTRLSPLFPFTLLNYAFGATRVKFWQYVLASWIGMIPGTLLYVYLGSLIGSFAELVADSPGSKPESQGARQIFFYLGLVATLAATVVIGRIAHKALTRALDAAENFPQSALNCSHCDTGPESTGKTTG